MATRFTRSGLVVRTMVIGSVLCVPGVSHGATLSLSSGSGIPGNAVDLDLSLSGTASVSPAGLQWTLSYSSADFSSVSVLPGPAAFAAGKSISCSRAGGATTCMAWGDNGTGIVDGVVATVRLVLSADGSNAASGVQISGGTAFDASGSTHALGLSGGKVSVLPSLNVLSCSPSVIDPPGSSSCTVGLTAPASGGGVDISLKAAPGVVSVPVSLTIPDGSISATFAADGLAVSVPTASSIAASYQGMSESFELLVRPAKVSSVSVDPGSVRGGRMSTGIVRLSAPAGSGGLVVTLKSSNPQIASVPECVTIAAGQVSATFAAVTRPVLKSTPTTLKAMTTNGGSKSVTLLLTPATVNVSSSR